MQLRKIMVATDFSEESKKALHSGVELARAAGSEVLLVHVMEFMVNPASLGIGPVLLATQEAELRERLGGALEAMRRADIPASVSSRALVLEGRPFREIVQAARDHSVDLIVIATRGHTGLKRVVFGSNAERVVREAPCPVLVVRDVEREPRR